TWCVDQQLIDRSPMEKVAKIKPQPSRERVLSEDELRAVYETALKLENGFSRLVWLITHTGGRRTETTRLEWPQIGPDTITFTAETTKGKHDHTIPIGPRTQALLKSFPRIDG